MDSNDDEETRKSAIALPNINFEKNENSNEVHSVGTNLLQSKSMQELQRYLESEQSLPPYAVQQAGSLGTNQLPSSDSLTGVAAENTAKQNANEEVSKRSEIPEEQNKSRSE